MIFSSNLDTINKYGCLSTCAHVSMVACLFSVELMMKTNNELVMTLHWKTYGNDLICNSATLEDLW